MTHLVVYTKESSPIYVGESFDVKLGIYDDIGALFDVTLDVLNITWNVLNGGNNVVIYQVPGQIKAMIPGSFRIQFTVTYQLVDYVYEYSFAAIEHIPQKPTQQQIYNCLKREEPAGVYSQSDDPLTSLTYNDNWSFSKLVSELYDYLDEQANNIFPEQVKIPSDGYVQEWEQMLTGQYNIYSPLNSKTPQVLQFIRNNGFSFNPYDLAFWVSQYIYLRMGQTCYVYIQEFLLPYNVDFWILDVSELDKNTVLGPDIAPGDRSKVIIHVLNFDFIIDPKIKKELEFLISIWGMLGVTYEFQYGEGPDAYGLIQDLGNTYKGDPRTIGIYCLKYDNNAVQKALGLTNPYAISKLQSIEIVPAHGTFGLSTIIQFDVIAHYLFGYQKIVTDDCLFTVLTPATLQATGPAGSYECIDVGAGKLKANYIYLETKAEITIEPVVTFNWTLNVSQLGLDTVLS